MALYTNFNQINEYMKIASSKDSCYVCAKKINATNKQDAYDIIKSLEGKIENQKVIVIRRSGIDTCICMDCIKDVYDNHIADTLITKEVEVEAEVEISEDKATTEIEEENKSSNTKKKISKGI